MITRCYLSVAALPPGPEPCSQLLPFKSTKEAGRAGGREKSLLLSPLSSQPRKENLKAILRKKPDQTLATTKKVEAMVGFWCFNKMFQGIKSTRRGHDRAPNPKIAFLVCRPQGPMVEYGLPRVAIFRGN